MPSFEQPTPEFGATAPSRFAGDLPYHADDVERIILGIIALYDKLRNLPTLEPLPENVPIFNQLFDLVTTTKTTKEESERILKDPRVESILLDIRGIWGTAEYYLERDFANSIICKGSQEACMKRYNSFPYLDQYHQLARMESNTIDTALGELGLPPVKRMACLGSGPTPFTALCFRERYPESVHFLNVDRDPEAIHLGSEIVRTCNFQNVSFLQEDVALLKKMSSFDVVHIAALIGTSAEEKTELLLKVAKCMKPGALILVRSTDSLRTVLYPRFEVDDKKVLNMVTPVVATRYYGNATSLTAIVVRVDERKDTKGISNGISNGDSNGDSNGATNGVH